MFGSGGWRFGAEPKSSNWVSLGSSPGLYIAALGSPHMVLLSWSRGNLCNLSFSPILCTFLEVAIIEGSFEVKLPTICTQSARNCRNNVLGLRRVEKVGFLKRRVRSHLGRCEIKSCTPLWREADLEVKMPKNRSSEPLLEVDMSKKRMRLWREAHWM